MGQLVHLLPWNPDAPVEPGKQAVLEAGVTGGRVRLFVGRHFGPECWGGFLSPDAAERFGRRLIGLAAEARAADARAAEGRTP